MGSSDPACGGLGATLPEAARHWEARQVPGGPAFAFRNDREAAVPPPPTASDDPTMPPDAALPEPASSWEADTVPGGPAFAMQYDLAATLPLWPERRRTEGHRVDGLPAAPWELRQATGEAAFAFRNDREEAVSLWVESPRPAAAGPGSRGAWEARGACGSPAFAFRNDWGPALERSAPLGVQPGERPASSWQVQDLSGTAAFAFRFAAAPAWVIDGRPGEAEEPEGWEMARGVEWPPRPERRSRPAAGGRRGAREEAARGAGEEAPHRKDKVAQPEGDWRPGPDAVPWEGRAALGESVFAFRNDRFAAVDLPAGRLDGLEGTGRDSGDPWRAEAIRDGAAWVLRRGRSMGGRLLAVWRDLVAAARGQGPGLLRSARARLRADRLAQGLAGLLLVLVLALGLRTCGPDGPPPMAGGSPQAGGPGGSYAPGIPATRSTGTRVEPEAAQPATTGLDVAQALAARPAAQGWSPGPVLPPAQIQGELRQMQATGAAGMGPIGGQPLPPGATGGQEAVPASATDSEPAEGTTMWLLRAGRYEEALAHVDGGLARSPGSPELLAVRARILVAAGRQVEALAALDSAILHAPLDADLYRLRAEVQRVLGNTSEARLDQQAAERLEAGRPGQG